MNGVLLKLAYDGTDFHGFARQVGVRTVQDTLLTAVRAMAPDVQEVRGMSRTDAGVHAMAQYVGFDTERSIAPRGWVLGLNHHLGSDLVVREARRVPVDYNPRFFAQSKCYLYRLHVERLPSPLAARTSWQLRPPFDPELARRELAALLGTHDFAAFRTASDARPNTVRTLTRASIEPSAEAHVLDIRVAGSGFMHNMVRIIVGTAVDVAMGRKKPGTMAAAMASLRREDAGRTAPPQGLHLESVELSIPLPPDAEPDVWPELG